MTINDRIMPHDRAAERALLGALLVDSDQCAEVAPIVAPEDFYYASYGLVYRVIMDLDAKLKPVDIVTVMAGLKEHGHADIGEGELRAESFLIDLISSAPMSYNAPTYARSIAANSQRRQLINGASELASSAWNQQVDLSETIERAQNMMHKIASDGMGAGRSLTPISDGLSEYIDIMERRFVNPVAVSGIETGYVDLDKVTNGLKRQELTVVAGRPGMGKTALLMGMVANLSVYQNYRGAIFSLEMSKAELRERLVSSLINVNLQALRRGNVTQEQQAMFYDAVGRLSEASLHINDLPGLTPASILADARRVDGISGLDYIMVDYLGLMSVPGTSSRYEQVSSAARALKNLAKDVNVPVIVAAQLNRGVEMRAEKRPMLFDLRDSGEIEEAADCVLSVYRPGYYDEGDPTIAHIGEIGILKQRNGPAGGKVELYWRDYSASYHNMTRTNISL